MIFLGILARPMSIYYYLARFFKEYELEDSDETIPVLKRVLNSNNSVYLAAICGLQNKWQAIFEKFDGTILGSFHLKHPAWFIPLKASSCC